MHVLGVYPSSTLSSEEAEDLIDAVKPSLVYVDVHPELLSVLEADVRAGRIGNDWKIPEPTPPFHQYDGAGFLVSLNIRNLLADNEMVGLMGAEAYGPWKHAIRAAIGVRPSISSGTSAAAVGDRAAGAAASSTGPGSQLLGFPMAMAYNNGESLDRPNNLAYVLIGNASTGSSAVSCMIGNPNAWFFGSELSPDPSSPAVAELVAAAGGGDASAATAAAVAAFKKSLFEVPDFSFRPDVEYTVSLPPETGYFTRTVVGMMQNEFRAQVNRAAAKHTAATADVEMDLLGRENRARARGDETTATSYALRAMTSQKQSQAIAYHIQTALDEIVNVAGGAGVDVAGAGSPAASSAAAAAPVAVAIVNLGGMASLQRNWSEAHPYTDLFPPLTGLQNFIGYAAPTAVGGGILYGFYRGYRRFPKTTGVIATGAAVSCGAIAYSAVYGDWTRYGNWVRSGLARPRVTSPLAKANN